ncbi:MULTISPECIES: helix-turn-helix transcriptional regulator [unclassified Rhizobium]|uniref:helix-turn-helix transcriptional regulator n=1 Tax=unclassified Rhizobium TaxID=2613769 RepID=UPI00135AFE3D|nr:MULTISPECIES: helix-turn-helix transcriptional regulator [unclassified Rhizobium]
MHSDHVQSKPLKVVLDTLGMRLEQYRISRNLKQEDVAKLAGLSRMTVSKLESGKGATLDTLVRVLRAYGLEERIFNVVPDASLSPLDARSAEGKPRQRVRSTEEEGEADEPWSWGDDTFRGQER